MYLWTMRKFAANFFENSSRVAKIVRKWGVIVAFDHIRNRLKRWELLDVYKFSNHVVPIGSSLSDTTEYQALCAAAIADRKVLARFKSEKNYTRILEHVNYEMGRKYLDFLVDEPAALELLLEVNRVEIGNPERYHFPGLGLVSPTQIRYAKILCEITELFGPLNNMRIIEIGVGNGGQCFQICKTYNVAGYFLYDLPVVQELTKLVLKTQGLTKEPSFPPISPLEENPSDLLISNYAFSELTREHQEIYFEKIIRHSNRGYVLFNHIQNDTSKSMSAEEFSSRIPGSIIIDETPTTHPDNVLIVWGYTRPMRRRV